MALTGHLSDLSLSELIEFFCNQRKTGRLKVLYPEGPGYFYLQTGSVVDARIGVLRGIDAVYYALTLPNAKFEFSGSTEATERSINQPWTQVVLEGLRRLDEGIVAPDAFPSTYDAEMDEEDSASEAVVASESDATETGNFLSFLQSDSVAWRKPYMIGAAAVALVAVVAVAGVPAGWYSRAKQPAAVTQQVAAPVETQPAPNEPTETTASPSDQPADDAGALAARRQRERERARARDDRAQTETAVNNASGNVPVTTSDTAKAGPKKVTVTVSYDESGRVTQASGADATAVRIARQRRFPAGKAGSTTITIPIN